MKAVTLYFDVLSPYAWLAWTQVPALAARTGARFVLEPVLLARLLDAGGTRGPAEIPAKRLYTFRDAARWAQRYRRPFVGPPAHPFNPLKALRLCAAVEAGEARNRLAGALLEGAWERGLDLTDPATLRSLADGVGLDGGALVAQTEDDGTKERLREGTERALLRGVFGVPTLVAERDGHCELFFGNDRLDMLEEWLGGGLALEEAQLAAMLARPAAARRKGG